MDIVQQLIQSNQQHLAVLKLPSTKITKFDGNPIHFYSFIKSFEMAVETHEDNPLQRLHRLIDATTGNVRRMLEGFQFYEPAEGYQCAKTFLQHKYGDPLMIRTAHMNPVKSCPAVQTGKTQITALEELTVSLRALIHINESISELRNLDHTDFIKEIVKSKLPIFMKREWASYIEQILSTHRRQLGLRDLLNFLERALNRLNNPYCHDLDINFGFKPDARPQIKKSNFTNLTNHLNRDVSSPKPMFEQPSSKVSARFCVICQSSSNFLNQYVKFRGYTYVDRVKLVNEHKLCFSCLSAGHKASKCSRQRQCRKCDGRHTTLLHPDCRPTTNSEGSGSRIEGNPQQSAEYNAVSHLSNSVSNVACVPKNVEGLNLSANNAVYTTNDKVFMPILPVKVCAPNCDVFCEMYALLDSGSDTTFCSENVLRELGISGNQTVLNLSTLQGPNTQIKTKVLNNLRVGDLHGNVELTIPITFTRPHLCVNENLIPKQEDINGLDYLHEVHLPELSCGVGLILGQNVSAAFVPQSVIHPPEHCKNGPFAVLTKLGWTISGVNVTSFFRNRLRPNNSYFVQNGDILCQSCSENIVASKSERLELSVEQQRFLKHVEENIKLNDTDHFEIKLPLKNPDLKLNNNKVQALQRLQGLRKRLRRNKQLRLDYVSYMNSLIENGYAEEVPASESNQEENCYYMPHHGVYSAQKPDKLRVVFDCSAKSNGLSLNDNLLIGPDLSCTLLGVLLRFRQETVALNADIRAMFHQVQIPYPDNNYFRYMWFYDNDIEKEPVEFRMKVYVFGTVTSPSVANFALKEIAKRFKDDFSAETLNTITSNFYVDDLLKSVATLDAAIKLRQEITAALAKAGFHITKWTSNSPELLATIPKEDIAVDCDGRTIEDCCSMPNKTALGIRWDIRHDKLGFFIDLPNKPRTRRGMLSMSNSIFDPMGNLTPITLRAKLILQKLCKLGLDWDDAVPVEVENEWNAFLTDAANLSKFVIDRCFKPTDFGFNFSI